MGILDTFEKGHVLTCLATECGHNKKEMCCAPEIEVGDEHPYCDSYVTNMVVENSDGEPHIAACQVMDCNFNDDAKCHAAGTTFIHHNNHVDCGTYRMGSS